MGFPHEQAFHDLRDQRVELGHQWYSSIQYAVSVPRSQSREKGIQALVATVGL